MVYPCPSELSQFIKMPFGLHRVAATLQLLMDKVLQPVSQFPLAYVDEIIIFSHLWEENLSNL